MNLPVLLPKIFNYPLSDEEVSGLYVEPMEITTTTDAPTTTEAQLLDIKTTTTETPSSETDTIEAPTTTEEPTTKEAPTITEVPTISEVPTTTTNTTITTTKPKITQSLIQQVIQSQELIESDTLKYAPVGVSTGKVNLLKLNDPNAPQDGFKNLEQYESSSAFLFNNN